MADDLQIQIDNDVSPITLLKNAYQNDFSQMNIIPVAEGEIQSTVCSLKAKGSTGYDGVSTKILKMCNTLISKPLSYICNKSTQTGAFPDCLNTFAASYLNIQGLNNSCLKSPESTLVDLTFQSRALRSFSLNQLRNLSL